MPDRQDFASNGSFMPRNRAEDVVSKKDESLNMPTSPQNVKNVKQMEVKRGMELVANGMDEEQESFEENKQERRTVNFTDGIMVPQNLQER